MDTTTAALLTALLVGGGKWSKGDTITPRNVVGVAFLAIALSLIAQADDKVARGFGLLIVVTATFTYGPSIVRKVGLTS